MPAFCLHLDSERATAGCAARRPEAPARERRRGDGAAALEYDGDGDGDGGGEDASAAIARDRVVEQLEAEVGDAPFFPTRLSIAVGVLLSADPA